MEINLHFDVQPFGLKDEMNTIRVANSLGEEMGDDGTVYVSLNGFNLGSFEISQTNFFKKSIENAYQKGKSDALR